MKNKMLFLSLLSVIAFSVKAMQPDNKRRESSIFKVKSDDFSVCLDPSTPINYAVKYCKKLRYTVNGNPVTFIQAFIEEGDPQALLLQRYFRTVISKAVSLRNPELKADQYGDELGRAIILVNSDLRDLTYIATGKYQPVLTQEEWNKQWKAVEKALDDDMPTG